jgi:DNA adenine methylase Dam
MTLIPSGINYVGNKFRMLSILFDNLDTSRSSFIDAFCGGGVVGINATDYYDNVLMNDGCWQLIAILDAIQNDNNFIDNVEKIINAYNLGKGNKEQFLECREEFNKKYSSPETFNPYMCYALACHSFSYNIVFNKNGGFSVPSGVNKSWFNPTLKGKLVAFQHVMQSKPIELFAFNFVDLFEIILESLDESEFKDTMIYLDPPYSAKCADGSISRSYGLRWNWEQDKLLMEWLDKFNCLGVHWLLSNVFENKGVENKPLKEWAEKYNVIKVPGVNYANAHYQAKPSKTVEVLIRNY